MSEGHLSLIGVTMNTTIRLNKTVGGLLSEELRLICQWIIYTVVCQIIDLFGIATNIINIICFIKQGFKDPVNISLLGLAFADLCCLTTLVWTNICYTPAFSEYDLPFDPIELQYLTSGMLNTTFARISGWITAMITLERCMCITVPLKVRSIVTPRRVLITITVIFVLLLASVSPLYVVNGLGLKFYQTRNRTLLGLVYATNREAVEQISFGINNVFIPLTSFMLVSICTVLLAFKLQRRTAWRTKTTNSLQADAVSNRNRKAAKMVVMISTLFIACFIPISIVFTAAILEPEFSIEGKYRNTLIVAGGICFVLESVNSSMNIFIYYHMSTRYRTIFRQLLYMTADKCVAFEDS